jgi:hypothetical protein
VIAAILQFLSLTYNLISKMHFLTGNLSMFFFLSNYPIMFFCKFAQLRKILYLWMVFYLSEIVYFKTFFLLCLFTFYLHLFPLLSYFRVFLNFTILSNYSVFRYVFLHFFLSFSPSFIFFLLWMGVVFLVKILLSINHGGL